ncbi:acyl carrier protein [Flexibacter flexilis DSM 6793]|uniref:Acyl carrier protein n=1 Tax=Flexibacter flexilis DSM 6793 TaxID=927664 RepID=A0A1I1MVX9_9BACT|nr:phosphopantetheine-binding protein [Flexibacter flexilis]SFC89266.1 acyl carrier protein [Flexibacter flexilis DSM 6793]
MKSSVQTRIERIFKKHFLIPSTAIKKNKRLNELGLNIMEQMEMMLYLETEFDINLDDREVQSIQTVGDAVSCVRQHLNVSVAYAAA